MLSVSFGTASVNASLISALAQPILQMRIPKAQEGEHCALQVEGLRCKPRALCVFTAATTT